MSGSILAQVILLAVTPLLTRIYTPDSFGAYSYLLAIATLITVVASLRLESAVPLPEDNDTARGVVRISLLCTLFVSVALVGIGYWVLPKFEDLESSLGTAAPIWLGGLVLTGSAYSILSQCALRSRAYGVVATRSVVQAVGISASQLLLALVTKGGNGLLGGQLLGRFAGFIPLVRESQALLRSPSIGTKRRALKKYWRFPAIFAPSALLNASGAQIPLLLVGYWYGLESAGQLGLAQRLTLAPMSVVGISIAQVFGAELAHRLRAGKMNNRSMYLRTTVKLSLIGVPVTILLLTLSPWLVPLILGSAWNEAGKFAQAMALSAGLAVIASPLSRVFTTYQRGGASILIDITRPVLVVFGAFIAHECSPDPTAMVWGSFTGLSINYILTWFVGLRVVSMRSEYGVEN